MAAYAIFNVVHMSWWNRASGRTIEEAEAQPESEATTKGILVALTAVGFVASASAALLCMFLLFLEKVATRRLGALGLLIFSLAFAFVNFMTFALMEA
jgi:hypothetical protein